MKKIVRLTESELKNIVEKSVRRAIKEGAVDESNFLKKAGLAAGITAGGLATLGTDNPASRALDRQFADQEEVSRAFPEDREEFGDKLKPQSELPPDTISWRNANGIPESRIRRAVMESIMKLMNEQG